MAHLLLTSDKFKYNKDEDSQILEWVKETCIEYNRDDILKILEGIECWILKNNQNKHKIYYIHILYNIYSLKIMDYLNYL